MTLIMESYSDWWDDVCFFLRDRVVPVLAVVGVLMCMFGLGITLYTAISHETRLRDTDFVYTNWDGHEYVVIHKGNSWGVTHSPRCKCLPDLNKILQEDRKPGIWMYMDVPVTNLPPMYYDGQPNTMLCGGRQ